MSALIGYGLMIAALLLTVLALRLLKPSPSNPPEARSVPYDPRLHRWIGPRD
jgi:hypothetical protein